MKTKLTMFVTLLVVVLAAVCFATLGCSSSATTATTSITQSTTTSTTSTATQPVNPIEVVSVIGPLPPINPGGPNIEVTLKNVSNASVISLSASLSINSTQNKPFDFSFAVSTSNPLLPGNEFNSPQLTLIGGGFSSDTLYPLEIIGSLQTGGNFDYTVQVKITQPPNTSITTTSSTTTTAISINVAVSSTLGTYLIDGNGTTLYWTTADAPGQSNVTGSGIAIWPVFYTQNISVPSTLNVSDFGRITRADGSKQTTFKNWPLYYFAQDAAAGQTNGQGLGGKWSVVSPSASGPQPISATTTTTTTSTQY